MPTEWPDADHVVIEIYMDAKSQRQTEKAALKVARFVERVFRGRGPVVSWKNHPGLKP